MIDGTWSAFDWLAGFLGIFRHFSWRLLSSVVIGQFVTLPAAAVDGAHMVITVKWWFCCWSCWRRCTNKSQSKRKGPEQRHTFLVNEKERKRGRNTTLHWDDDEKCRWWCCCWPSPPKWMAASANLLLTLLLRSIPPFDYKSISEH